MIIVLVTLIVVGLFLKFYISQNLLISTGFSEYNNERKQVDIELVNQGHSDIQIQEVQVNNKVSEDVQLVISYSAQLVAGGIDDEPLAKFISIKESPIHPQLSTEEFKKAVLTKTTPINYGIRVRSEEDIEIVKIKYKYFGFTFTREVNLNTWPQ